MLMVESRVTWLRWFAANGKSRLVEELVNRTAQFLLRNRVAFAQAERLRLGDIEEALHAEPARTRIFHLARHVVIRMLAAELRKVELRGRHHVEPARKVRVARENLVRLFFDPVNRALLLERHNADGHRLENRNSHIHRNRIDGCETCYRGKEKKEENQYA